MNISYHKKYKKASFLSLYLLSRRAHQRGFTIVELLIVIVVIAILAAIGIISYNNMSNRASNLAIIDSAGKILRHVQAYTSLNGEYPIYSTSIMNVCATYESGCHNENNPIPARSDFNMKMDSIATLPRTVPSVGDDRYGIHLSYYAPHTFNGESRPLSLVYYLYGVNQSCGLSGVAGPTWPNTVSSSTEYTVGNHGATGKTLCRIVIPGPAHT